MSPSCGGGLSRRGNPVVSVSASSLGVAERCIRPLDRVSPTCSVTLGPRLGRLLVRTP
jgi:hypothetical protein